MGMVEIWQESDTALEPFHILMTWTMNSNTKLNNVFSVTNSILYSLILIINHLCSVTGTKCRPNIIGHYKFTLLQLLSLPK